MKQTVDMVVGFGPAESVMQVMTFQSHNQYPQLKESDAINDITAKTCQSETSTTNLNENFKTCCLCFSCIFNSLYMSNWTICFRSPQNSNQKTRTKMAGTTKVDSQLLEPCIFTSSCLGKWTFEPSSKLPIHPLIMRIMRGNWNYRVPIPIDPWMDSNEANTRPKLLLVWISTNNAIATCVQVTVSGWMHKIDTVFHEVDNLS